MFWQFSLFRFRVKLFCEVDKVAVGAYTQAPLSTESRTPVTTRQLLVTRLITWRSVAFLSTFLFTLKVLALPAAGLVAVAVVFRVCTWNCMRFVITRIRQTSAGQDCRMTTVTMQLDFKHANGVHLE